MKYFILAILVAVGLNASMYYAKVEPLQKYSIKSATSGKVLASVQKLEGKVSNGQIIVHLDDVLNKEDLKNSAYKLKILNKMIEITEKNFENAKKWQK